MKDQSRLNKPKLTDAERHRRFVETAKKVEASESLDEFDSVFKTIVTHTSRRRPDKVSKNSKV